MAGPADLLSSLMMTFRFTNAGIPIRSFSMSSRSEEPTLRVGDVVLADLRSAGQEPARGDLIVFRLRDGKTEWMKRVVGLSGERIAMIDGRLSINGAVVTREPLPAYAAAQASGVTRSVSRYLETLPGGVAHEIIETDGDGSVFDRMAETLVPQGACFVLGDNRDNSLDSRDRTVGFVLFSDIVGRIVYRLRPDPTWLVAESSVPGL